MVVEASIPVNIHIANATMTTHGTMTTRGPKISNSFPEIGPIKLFIILPGSIIIPDLKAVSSNTPCKYIGSSAIVENILIIMVIISTTIKANIGYLKVRKLRIGFLILSCLKINHANDKQATLSVQ